MKQETVGVSPGLHIACDKEQVKRTSFSVIITLSSGGAM